MKKELKGFVGGVVATTLVAGGAAFATGQWKTIDVLENDITVMVDGKQVSESNFVYNDRTYLPLRAVAEAVGKPVDYDEATNTAYIGDKPAISASSNNNIEFSTIMDYLNNTYSGDVAFSSSPLDKGKASFNVQKGDDCDFSVTIFFDNPLIVMATEASTKTALKNWIKTISDGLSSTYPGVTFKGTVYNDIMREFDWSN